MTTIPSNQPDNKKDIKADVQAADEMANESATGPDDIIETEIDAPDETENNTQENLKP